MQCLSLSPSLSVSRLSMAYPFVQGQLVLGMAHIVETASDSSAWLYTLSNSQSAMIIKMTVSFLVTVRLNPAEQCMPWD